MSYLLRPHNAKSLRLNTNWRWRVYVTLALIRLTFAEYRLRWKRRVACWTKEGNTNDQD